MKGHTQKQTLALGVFASLCLALTPILTTILTTTNTLAVTKKCPDPDSSVADPNWPPDCKTSSTFTLNVTEILSVSLTLPDTWASGDTGDFVRNAVRLNVASNNGNGFTASMTTKTADTNLTNKVKNVTTDAFATIPTLAADTARSNFPANYWGYSLNDTAGGEDTSTYKALVGAGGTPISVLTSNAPANLGQDIYFGAKIDATKDSGTYVNTVVFNVVSGVINENTNPITPVDPATKDDTSENNPAYDETNDRTVYASTTNNTSSGTTTETLEVSNGDTRSSYARPQGVKNSSETNIGEGVPLATGLAVTAGIAATLGAVFFVVAKRKERKDEEEQ